MKGKNAEDEVKETIEGWSGASKACLLGSRYLPRTYILYDRACGQVRKKRSTSGPGNAVDQYFEGRFPENPLIGISGCLSTVIVPRRTGRMVPPTFRVATFPDIASVAMKNQPYLQSSKEYNLPMDSGKKPGMLFNLSSPSRAITRPGISEAIKRHDSC